MNVSGIPIPSNIQIGPHIYKIVFPYCFKENKTLYGQYDSALCEIRLAEVDGCGSRLAESKILQTLWHELIHGIDDVFNGAKLEEDVVDRISNGIAQVFLQWIDLVQDHGKDIEMTRGN